MQVITTTRHPIKLWVGHDPIEPQAMEQLTNIANMSFVFNHLAVMPDVHLGKGATVGSVIATQGAIIPAAVGVDIGCGMIALHTNLKASDLPDNLHAIRTAIEEVVPHGRSDNGGAGDIGAHKEVDAVVVEAVKPLFEDFKKIVEKHPTIVRNYEERIFKQCGTLGTGNHFIELCLDENQDVWIMLHSGSRGTGNSIGTYFINRAKEDMEKWFITLPDRDLAYIPDNTERFMDYIDAVHWAQDYAFLNRTLMMDRVLLVLNKFFPNKELKCSLEAINCHHNYVSREKHFGKSVLVTRKGAVSAQLGELGIIPGSMGAKSFIVSGKGNRESFTSCSHGAGRKHSRTAAKKLFTLEDHIHATEGVECRKDLDVVDETPMAYKDIDDVMNAQSDLVDIVHTLKQVMCVKG